MSDYPQDKVLFIFETDYGIKLNLIPDTEKLMKVTGLNHIDSAYFAIRAVEMYVRELEKHIKECLPEIHKVAERAEKKYKAKGKNYRNY